MNSECSVQVGFNLVMLDTDDPPANNKGVIKKPVGRLGAIIVGSSGQEGVGTVPP